MKDIGYYAGFLTDKDQQEVTSASRLQLLDLIGDIAHSLMSGEAVRPLEIEDFWLSDHSDSEANRLALIRGLCDRIELRLMETAK